MISKKNCGNCREVASFRMRGGAGICDMHDAKVYSDTPRCPQWKGKKYKRNKNALIDV